MDVVWKCNASAPRHLIGRDIAIRFAYACRKRREQTERLNTQTLAMCLVYSHKTKQNSNDLHRDDDDDDDEDDDDGLCGSRGVSKHFHSKPTASANVILYFSFVSFIRNAGKIKQINKRVRMHRHTSRWPSAHIKRLQFDCVVQSGGLWSEMWMNRIASNSFILSGDAKIWFFSFFFLVEMAESSRNEEVSMESEDESHRRQSLKMQTMHFHVPAVSFVTAQNVIAVAGQFIKMRNSEFHSFRSCFGVIDRIPSKMITLRLSLFIEQNSFILCVKVSFFSVFVCLCLINVDGRRYRYRIQLQSFSIIKWNFRRCIAEHWLVCAGAYDAQHMRVW